MIFERDKRSPTPKDHHVSKVMSANKAKNTTPEIKLRRALRENSLKGYRINFKKLPGKPDITFISKKVAIFVNGCFWHNCPKCNLKLPKHNVEFWMRKFSDNEKRDLQKRMELESMGWSVLTIWECEIKNDLEEVISKIKCVWNVR